MELTERETSRTSKSFVKKKAALTLLRLYRKHPDVIPAADWALRIVSILDDQNLVRPTTPSLRLAPLGLTGFSLAQGVVVAVASLVLALAQDNLEAYAICYQKAVNRLSKVRWLSTHSRAWR